MDTSPRRREPLCASRRHTRGRSFAFLTQSHRRSRVSQGLRVWTTEECPGLARISPVRFPDTRPSTNRACSESSHFTRSSSVSSKSFDRLDHVLTRHLRFRRDGECSGHMATRPRPQRPKSERKCEKGVRVLSRIWTFRTLSIDEVRVQSDLTTHARFVQVWCLENVPERYGRVEDTQTATTSRSSSRYIQRKYFHGFNGNIHADSLKWSLCEESLFQFRSLSLGVVQRSQDLDTM